MRTVNINAKEELKISDLTDEHLIGMEYNGHPDTRGRIRKINNSLYVAVSAHSITFANNEYDELITGSSIQDLISQFKRHLVVRQVVVFDTPNECKEWLLKGI